jgi:hypothetical protein
MSCLLPSRGPERMTAHTTVRQGRRMSFKSQLAALRGKVARELPAGSFDRLQAETADLRVSGKWRAALKAGEAAPDLRPPALGASLIAIAPRTAVTQAVCAVSPPFPLLADVDTKVCKSFGLTFLPPNDLRDAYGALGCPASDEHLALPVPAIYVIDRSSMIVFSYLDTDFTRRLDPREILVVLRRPRATQEAVGSDASLRR